MAEAQDQDHTEEAVAARSSDVDVVMPGELGPIPENSTDVAALETEVLAPTGSAEYPNSSRIGPYEIQGVIGKGGMGVVYKARVAESCSIPIGKTVALKMLSDRRLEDGDRKRFEREAAYLQALRHPGIVRILDIGEWDDRPFLVMQLVEGQTLDQILRKRRRDDLPSRLTPAQAADIMTQALEALHVAHIAGIVHRDLKPGNIMLTPQGAVKILDFGMAHRVNVDSHLTATGSVLGTPAYMSPEQAAGRRTKVDVRSDIYAMGAVCYELVTGKQPFMAENSMAMLRLIIEGDLTPPTSLIDELDAEFETIILKAMFRDRRDRYHSAEDMAEDLRRWRAGDRIRARRLNPWIPLLRKAFQHRRTLSMVTLAMFVMAVVVILSVRYMITVSQQQAEQTAEAEERARALEERTEIASKIIARTPAGRALDWSRTEFSLVRNDLLGDEFVTFHLGSVTTHPDLAMQVQALANDTKLELMICDPDVGRGYSLQITRDHEAGDGLALLRGAPASDDTDRNLIVRQPADFSRPFSLRFRRNHETGYIEAWINGELAIRFWDPTPIDGPDNAEVYLAGEPGKSEIRDLRLSRVEMPELASRIHLADMARHFGRNAAAIRIYQELLGKAEPDSTKARDIRYRLGLCYAASDKRSSLEDALAQFDWVVGFSRNDEDKAYFLAAMVQAWVSTIRLGQLDAAETYFEELQGHDLNQVLVSVPRAQLEKVPTAYLDRAIQTLASDEDDNLERAEALYAAAAKLATYLRKWKALVQAVDGQVEVALTRDQAFTAARYYWRLMDLDDLPASLRYDTMLKLAGMERLSGRPETAIELYREVMEQDGKPKGDRAQWARLWLGDLWWYENDRQEAATVWKSSRESRSLPGQIMRNLLTKKRQLTFNKRYKAYVVEFEYFNAVAWLVQGPRGIGNYHKQLAHLRDRWAAGVWPAPLARQILDASTTRTME